MNGSRHNKNANRHTEIPAFIREKNMFSPLPPKLQIFGVDYYRSFETQKMVFGPALMISFKRDILERQSLSETPTSNDITRLNGRYQWLHIWARRGLLRLLLG